MGTWYFLTTLGVIITFVSADNTTSDSILELLDDVSNSSEAHETHHGVKVAGFKLEYVREPLVLTTFFLVIGIFKLAYHHTRFTKKILPESCCLIILGIILGLLFIGDKSHESIRFLEFNSKTFFFFLLPPIILESAYSLKDRAFIENFGTIVLYAVLGTVMNIVLIGGLLLILAKFHLFGSLDLSILDTFVFASLIAAVDPVAVLAVFQELGVNKMLYFMVFGESLLNDAVTIVCYNLAIEFKELPEFTFFDCFMGFLAFLCVSLGGLFIGLICGFVSALITRFTSDVRVVEPVILFGLSYMAYILSELFHFSGIIALIACGLFQTHYASSNISPKSFLSITYFTKVMSSMSEALIFIILGVMLVNEQEWFWSDWHPTFSIFSIIICVVVRFAVTFFLTYVVNQFTGGVRHISFPEQCIMAYGGLRGAVSFSLAFMITGDEEVKNTILSATYMVILFTVFIQGASIKPLVKLLNITLASDDNFRLFIEFNRGIIVNLSQGIEDLCGYKNYNWVNTMSAFSKRFIRPILQKDYKNQKREKLLEMDRAFTMKEAMINSPSTSSFKRQQTIDEMTDAGVIPVDVFEDEHLFTHATTDDIEKQTELLTKDVTSIRHLMSNPYDECYMDRNLVHEEEKEKKQIHHMNYLQSKAKQLTKLQRKRSIFGRRKSIRKAATQQGLIHSAITTLGVSMNQPSTSHAVHREHDVQSLDEEEGLLMKAESGEAHPLYTITESSETN